MNSGKWYARRVARRLALAVVLAAMVGAAGAVDIYKWVDENGTTHYSDVKPAGVKAQRMIENKLSIIPGSRIGAEAARAAERERASANRNSAGPTYDEATARARSDRREQLMEDCERNRGTDCQREVDTQLRAEGIQEGRGVIRTVPPPVNVTPAPVPTPSPSRSLPASALR